MIGSKVQSGIVLLVIFNGLTAAVDAFAKHLSRELHSVQITWGFFLLIFLSSGVLALLRGNTIRSALLTERLGLQMTRSAVLILTIVSLFVGIAYIPFADAIAISFMAPLFITVLAVPMLGEAFRWHRLSAVLVGLVGVVVIIQPGTGVLHWAACMPLAAGVFFALFQIMTRKLTVTDNWFTTFFYTGAGGLFWVSLAVGFFWRPLTLEHLALFAVMGLLGAGAHFCIVKALEAAQASLLAPFNYAKLIWAAAIGYLFFAETPSLATLLGSTIIVASGLFVLHHEHSGKGSE